MLLFSAPLPLKKKNSIPSIAIRFVDEVATLIDENTPIPHKAPSPDEQALPEALEATASTSSVDSTRIEPLENTEVKKPKKTAKHHDTSIGKKESE